MHPVPSPTPRLPGGASVDPELVRLLREAVLAHKTASPRGHLPPVLHAGLPGTREVAQHFRPTTGDHLDHDVRVEVAVALANRAREEVAAPLLWLSRSGDLEPAPCDLRWWAAGREAWAQLGLEPSFVVLTRHGWRHEPSGASKAWQRLRHRR